ncbi:hypothetical protein MBGDN05_00633, partial [Thermoplasmatales archaeon SCGC AB-539-N05]
LMPGEVYIMYNYKDEVKLVVETDNDLPMKPSNPSPYDGEILVKITEEQADVNGDGIVTMGDALMIGGYIHNGEIVDPPGLESYDVNNDGVVTFSDFSLVLSYYIGSNIVVLSVDVFDVDNDMMDVSFYWADGSLIGTSTDIASGEIAFINAEDLEFDVEYSWYAIADDGKDTAQSDTWSFRIVSANDDTSPPVTTYFLSGEMGDNGSQEYYKSSVLVRLRAIDNMNRIEEIAYRVDNGEWQHDYPSGPSDDLYVAHSCQFTVGAEGSHIVEFYAVDEVGNIEDIKSSTFKIDMTAPTTNVYLNSISAPHDGWYISDVTVTLDATDDASGIKGTYYAIDRGSFQPHKEPFTLETDGIHVINYYSIDEAGNEEETKSVRVQIDRTLPGTKCFLDGKMKKPSLYVTPVKIILKAEDELSGVWYTKYKVDNGKWQIYRAPRTITGSGRHTVYYYSVDNAGNRENTKTTTFMIHPIFPSPYRYRLRIG